MSGDVLVGQRYDVTIVDCCIEGVQFSAVLTEIVTNDDDPEGEYRGYVFDNGVAIKPGWNGGVTLEASGNT